MKAAFILLLFGLPLTFGVDVILLTSKVVTRGEKFNASVLLKASSNDNPVPTSCSITVTLLDCYLENIVALKTQAVNLDQTTPFLIDIPSSVLADAKYNSMRVKVGSTDCSSVNLTSESWSSGCVRFSGPSIVTYIQTDKRMYKPGQTVNLRVFALYSANLTAVTTTPFQIEVFDAQNNKIQEWRDERSESGVISKTLPISTRPVLGDWLIRAKLGSLSRDTVMTVAEYVLPTFEVKVSLPTSYYVRDSESFTVEVQAVYTYGKAVYGPGSIELSVNDPYYYPYYANAMIRKPEENDAPVAPRLPQDSGNADPASLPLKRQFSLTAEQPVARLSFSRAELQALESRYKRGRDYFTMSQISIVAFATEQVTGVVRNTTASANVFDSPYKMSVIDGATPQAFRSDFPYVAFLKVAKQDDSTVSDAELASVGLSVSTTFTCIPPYNNYYSPVQASPPPQIAVYRSAIGSNGIVIANVTVPSSSNCSQVTLTATLSATAAGTKLPGDLVKQIPKFGSVGNVVVKVSSVNSPPGGAASWSVGQSVNVQTTIIGASVPVLYYAIVSRGVIIQRSSIQSSSALRSPESWHLPITQNMAPKSVLLVWTVVNGEVIGDNLELDVDGALQDVSLQYDSAEKQVGESAQLRIQSAAKSFVGVLAVDKSALLLTSDSNDLKKSAFLQQALCKDDSCSVGNDVITPYFGMRAFGCYVPWFMYDSQNTRQLFDKAGFLILTSYQITGMSSGGGIAYSAVDGDVMMMAENMAMGPMLRKNVDAASGSATATTEVKVRRSFPETWMWLDFNSNENAAGLINVTKPVADSITTWITTAFALHPTRGVGVADAAELRVFNPFFISLQLPYSVVRGEQFELKVLVFNYAVDSDSVQVTLERSDDFKVAAENDIESSYQAVTETVTVQRDVPQSVTFRVTPTRIGKITIKAVAIGTSSDALERELIVIPEGIPQVGTQPFLVTLSDQQPTFSINLPIAVPANTVSGSLRVGVTAVGDFMGSSVNGIDSLLRMPYGCGEQNMLNFAPNIYITRYLQVRGMLTDAIKDKSQNYMLTGYQRELTYKRNDNSFSAFGQQDEAGSLWLSAFVVRCFQQAKSLTYIDDKVVSATTEWIFKRFDSRAGSFVDPGRVLHAEMQGGSAKGVALSAYTLIALLEDPASRSAIFADSQRKQMVDAVVGSIEQTSIDSLSSYELSIVLYALTLYGDSGAINPIVTRLDSMKVLVDDIVYWPASASRTAVTPIEIETAAYVLLRYVRVNDVTSGLPVLRWLVSKRNQDGGFMSTQDTVIGLQALSEFAALISPSGQLNAAVSVKVGTAYSGSVTVNSANQLLVQKLEIPADVDVKSVQLTASGRGVVLLQVTWDYNLLKSSGLVSSPVTISAVSKLQESGKLLILRVCNKWTDSASSGMFLAEANLPTGYSLDSSVEELQSQFKGKSYSLKMVELNGDRTVSLYFDEIPRNEEVCTTIRARESMRVANRQPAVLRSMPYYEPQKQAVALYSAGNEQNLPDSQFFDYSAAAGIRWSWIFIVSQLLVAYICVLLGCIVYI